MNTSAHASMPVLQKMLETTPKPVAIFDLDGTLFDVNYRHLEILKRFCVLCENDAAADFKDLTDIVKKARYEDVLYNIEATLNQMGIDRYSERKAHFMHRVETFWVKHFFTDELIEADRPYAGALECVKFFYSQGAHIVYLSGRDIPNMSQGTLLSLEKYGFPHNGHRVSICLKPAYGMNDLAFKKQSLDNIDGIGSVIASFDNEPANVQLFLEHYPESVHYHFDTQYAKAIPLSGKHFHAIKSFTELGF